MGTTVQSDTTIGELIQSGRYGIIFMCHCIPTVLKRMSFRVLDRLLTDLKVPHKLNLGKQGGHSFGLGNGVDTEGWIEDMLSFWKQNDQN